MSKHVLLSDKYSRAFIGLIVVWLVIVLLSMGPLWSPGTLDDSRRVAARMDAAVAQLQQLKQQNSQLLQLIKQLTDVVNDDSVVSGSALSRLRDKLASSNLLTQASTDSCQLEPSLQYEMSRRQLRRDIDESWRYMRHQLSQLEASLGGGSVRHVSQSLAEYYHTTLSDWHNMSDVDGWRDWRQQESRRLKAEMRRRLTSLQNPANCRTARKLVCNLNKSCGFGCQFHHVTYCLIVAYSSSRTLVLRSNNWRYNAGGWHQVFLPVSETCTSEEGRSSALWPGSVDTQVISLPPVDMLRPRPEFLPLAIPRDLSTSIERLHGDPSLWFIAQFVDYLFRLQPDIENSHRPVIDKVVSSRPCVGIQVRRTDKVGSEAAFHPVEAYMSHVQQFFERQSMMQGDGEPVRRCVLVASDDASVFTEVMNKYPSYTVLGDQEVARSASVSSRYTKTSLLGVIRDIVALSHTDHLVCTFSSQVCRLAYELMQNRWPDAANRFTSLDDIYYFGGQSAHEQTARLSHEPRSSHEIALKIGDIVGIAGNHWDGFSKGENRRTGAVGLYPAFKAVERLRIVDFPLFNNKTQL